LAFFATAFFAAHRFFKAATMFALPAALSVRFGSGGANVAGADGSDSPRIFAHLVFCPRAILRLAAAEIFRFGVAPPGVGAGSALPPDSTARSSAICVSICRFCSSNPRMAAVMISGVSFIVMSASTVTHPGHLLRAGIDIFETREEYFRPNQE
jgi:hypothetical protein